MRLNKYFKRSEFLCKGVEKGICLCGYDTVDHITFGYLQSARIYFERPLIITSGCRCLKYNRYVGSNDNSQHVAMRAVDHYIKEVSLIELFQFYEHLFNGKYGLGLYDTFVHMDTRSGPGARW
jgi:uncharacterized protein YcbK (DUF882 family)